METDRALKELFVAESTSLVRRLGGAEPKEWLNVELPQTRAPRVDLVAELEDGSLFHLEFQTASDPEMPWRQLDYYSLLFQRYHREPRHVVLYLGNAPVRMEQCVAHERLQFRYDVVDIREWSGEELLASSLAGDAMLAVLCETPEPSARVKAIVERLGRLEEGRRERALRLLLILSGLRRLTAQVVEEVKHMSSLDAELLKDDFWRGILERGRKEGEEQGIDRGVRESLEIALTERFGPLPDWARQRIAEADRARLYAWLRRLGAASLDEALLHV